MLTVYNKTEIGDILKDKGYNSTFESVSYTHLDVYKRQYVVGMTLEESDGGWYIRCV